MENTQPCVAYYILLPRKKSEQMLFSNQTLAIQQQRLQTFITAHSDYYLATNFIESSETRRHRHHWPELEKAIEYCITHHCHLIITEIGNLTREESFIKPLLDLLNRSGLHAENTFAVNIYCCDQPFINRENFVAVIDHAKQQKQQHGQLIKAGLSRTCAKSGNPHAAEIIQQINKPKVENAILFALLLQPIIENYQARGYSQRKIMAALNAEEVSAPEGGQWVLSQLQKMLERIKWNQAALKLATALAEYQLQGFTAEQIAHQFNSQGIACPQGLEWNKEWIVKLQEREQQIKKILELNDFIIEIFPILTKYHVDEFHQEILSQELKQTGINLPPHSAQSTPI